MQLNWRTKQCVPVLSRTGTHCFVLQFSCIPVCVKRVYKCFLASFCLLKRHYCRKFWLPLALSKRSISPGPITIQVARKCSNSFRPRASLVVDTRFWRVYPGWICSTFCPQHGHGFFGGFSVSNSGQWNFRYS